MAELLWAGWRGVRVLFAESSALVNLQDDDGPVGRLASLVVNPPPYHQEVEGSIMPVWILFNKIGYPV